MGKLLFLEDGTQVSSCDSIACVVPTAKVTTTVSSWSPRAYSGPYDGFNTFHLRIHLTLTGILWDRHYYDPHFLQEVTDLLSNLTCD